MFEDKRNLEHCVRPISFQTIDDDYHGGASSAIQTARDCKKQYLSGKRAHKVIAHDEEQDTRFNLNGITATATATETATATTTTSIRHRKTRTTDIGPNFSLEYSYPAVILENVCFSVDKSQQQANFLKECLVRLNSCTSPLIGANGSSDGNKVQILKSVNLNVPHGSIFGLLGPSSCGKTTLLRCLVGLLKPSSGSIRLFGSQTSTTTTKATATRSESKHANETTGSGNTAADDDDSCFSCLRRHASHRAGNHDCKVPGPNVGYMPQDLGLYEDFTIDQLLTMFGRYMRMDYQLIKSRIAFMAKFLELPEVSRQVQTLSGGQKRRVSFAIACLHMPPLIILDEPTVGVDPLLRRSIWKYLRRMASEENKTIIITTHYIEEAAQADQVALMRAGEILIQDTPARIMELHRSRTLEEAFLKICNNVQTDKDGMAVCEQQDGRNSSTSKQATLVAPASVGATLKLFPQPQFNWNNQELSIVVPLTSNKSCANRKGSLATSACTGTVLAPDELDKETVMMNKLTLGAEEELLAHDDKLNCRLDPQAPSTPLPLPQSRALDATICPAQNNAIVSKLTSDTNLSMIPSACRLVDSSLKRPSTSLLQPDYCANNNNNNNNISNSITAGKTKKLRRLKRSKFTINNGYNTDCCHEIGHLDGSTGGGGGGGHGHGVATNEFQRWRQQQQKPADSLGVKIHKALIVFWALLYKNYRRNVNSLPLLAFQFMLPMIQMISFSLCVGGRPTNVGLGIVNLDQPISFSGGAPGAAAGDDFASSLLTANNSSTTILDPNSFNGDTSVFENDSLSLKYLSFIDRDMLHMIPYDNLSEALKDVRRAKLWAVLEIGENFTTSIEKRFDLDNFYQLEVGTISQSVIRIYPDRSNKILDMICHRSLVDSFRKFLADEFEHFKRLPIEVARPIFDIKPNAISNSIDGYTESIAPGLLASLTYIMAAGLTTFIMVVERSAGILERTYTSGINPIAYLLAHAIFRSIVMMVQIAAVLILTFYVLQQPIVGSIWLAYSMLMVLNMTGISYGLLISSIVTDQNGAALTIVSSLVVKITLSGILWPFEAIPVWLRTICYIQPLTMPVQALKAITLKGATLGDRSVNLGFIVSITWLIVFLTISAKRFKFYQH